MKTLRQILFLMVTAAIVFSASPAFASSLQEDVLYYVNIERQANGVQPLSYNSDLGNGASIRANEASVLFAHQRPDGREVKSVLNGAEHKAELNVDGAAAGGTITTTADSIVVGQNTKVSAAASDANGTPGTWNINSTNTATISDQATTMLNQLKAAQSKAETARAEADKAAQDAAAKKEAAEKAAQAVTDAQKKLNDLTQQAADKAKQNKDDAAKLQAAKDALEQAQADYNTKQSAADAAADKAAVSKSKADQIDQYVQTMAESSKNWGNKWRTKKLSWKKAKAFDNAWKDLNQYVGKDTMDSYLNQHLNKFEKWVHKKTGISLVGDAYDAATDLKTAVDDIRDTEAGNAQRARGTADTAKTIVDGDTDIRDKAQNAADTSAQELAGLNTRKTNQEQIVKDAADISDKAQKDSETALAESKKKNTEMNNTNTAYASQWTETGSVIDNTVLSNALNGANVNVKATNGASNIQAADVQVKNAVAKTGTADTALTLTADRNVAVTADITSSNSKLGLTMSANQDKTTNNFGANIIEANIDTNGGDITVNGGTYIGLNQAELATAVKGTTEVTRTINGGNIRLDGDVVLATGHEVALTGTGDVTVTGTINSGNAYAAKSDNTAKTWENAKKLAQGNTGGAGAAGDTYLATITSGIEDSVISSTVTDLDAAAYKLHTNSQAYVGGYSNDAKTWTWQTGPEAGQNVTYTNWHTGEPNNQTDGNKITSQPAMTVNYSTLNNEQKDHAARWDNLENSGKTTHYIQETNLAATTLTVSAGNDVKLLGSVGNTANGAALDAVQIQAGHDINTAKDINSLTSTDISAGHDAMIGKDDSGKSITAGTAVYEVSAGNDVKVTGDITAATYVQVTGGNTAETDGAVRTTQVDKITVGGAESTPTVSISGSNGTTVNGAVSSGDVTISTTNANDTIVKGEIYAKDTASISAVRDVKVNAAITSEGAAQVSAAHNVSVQDITAKTILAESTATGWNEDNPVGTVTLNGKIKAAAQKNNEAIVIGTNGYFVNNVGSDVLSTDEANGGYWKVYSQTPLSEQEQFGTEKGGVLASGHNAIWNDMYETRGYEDKLAYYTASNDANNRYIFAYQPTVTLTAGNASKTYGETFTPTAENLTVTDDSAAVKATLNTAGKGAYDENVATHTAAAASSAGFAATARRDGGDLEDSEGNRSIYAISFKDADGNAVAGLNGYKVVETAGKLTIDRRDIQVTTDTVQTYGTETAEKTTTVAATGNSSGRDALVNGDQLGTVTSHFGKDYTDNQKGRTTADAGTYTNVIDEAGITGADGSDASVNYDVKTAGTATVNKADLTVTTAGINTTYGTVNTNYQTTHTALVNGDTDNLSYSHNDNGAYRDAGHTGDAGTYNITTTASGDALKIYNVTYNNGTINIDKANLTVTTADVNTTYGTVDKNYQTTHTNLVNGDADTITYTYNDHGAYVSDTRTGSVGDYALDTTAQGNVLRNYNVTTNTANINLDAATVNLNPSGEGSTTGTATITEGTPSYVSQLVNGDTTATAPTVTYAVGSNTSGNDYAIIVDVNGNPIVSGDVVGNYRFNYAGVATITPAAAPTTPSTTPADNTETPSTTASLLERVKLDYRDTSNLAGSGLYSLAQGADNVPGVNKILGLTDAQLPFFKVAGGQVSNYGTYDVTETPTEVKVTPTAKHIPEPNKEKNQYRALSKTYELTNGTGAFNLVYDGTTFNIYPADANAKSLLKAGDAQHNVEVGAKALYSSFNEMGIVLEDLDAIYIHTDATEDEAKA